MMRPSKTNSKPEKLQVFEAFLEAGLVRLHLDPRVAGVEVPPIFSQRAHLILEYGLNLPTPIPNLDLEDDAVTGTLSFSRVPHFTVVPWDAVFAIEDSLGNGIIYEEDVPEEVALLKLGSEQVRPALQLVPGEPGDGPSESSEKTSEPEKPSEPPKLRLVK